MVDCGCGPRLAMPGPYIPIRKVTDAQKNPAPPAPGDWQARAAAVSPNSLRRQSSSTMNEANHHPWGRSSSIFGPSGGGATGLRLCGKVSGGRHTFGAAGEFFGPQDPNQMSFFPGRAPGKVHFGCYGVIAPTSINLAASAELPNARLALLGPARTSSFCPNQRVSNRVFALEAHGIHTRPKGQECCGFGRFRRRRRSWLDCCRRTRRPRDSRSWQARASHPRAMAPLPMQKSRRSRPVLQLAPVGAYLPLGSSLPTREGGRRDEGDRVTSRLDHVTGPLN